MPQMEGIEAAERIVRQHPDARVVMVSSVGYQENIVAALQKGARHFVQKPVKPEVLYEVIKYVMGEDARHRSAPPPAGADAMKMELIQPFINAADAVLAQSLDATRASATSPWKKKPIAAKEWPPIVTMNGDIEGRVIFDLDRRHAVRVACALAGSELPESDDLVRETICELANQVIGNAVTTPQRPGIPLPDPSARVHTAEQAWSSEDTEALVMGFDTPSGSVFMNIAMRFPKFVA